MSCSIDLLLMEFLLLEIFKSGGQLSQVFPHSRVLKGQVIDLLLLLVKMLHHSLVLLVDFKLSLDAMVLLIQEVDLVLQLLHSLLIQILLILGLKLV